MKDNIKQLLQNKDSNLTEWEKKFLESIFNTKKQLSPKQNSILNKIFVKNNLLSTNQIQVGTGSDDLLVKKLEQIVIKLSSHKDKRFEFFSSVLKFYYSRNYLSQKQKNSIQKFDMNYSGKSWTARPK
jgi:hypothetical protein